MSSGGWKAVPGFVGWYEAHPSGLIRSVDREIVVSRKDGRTYSIRCAGKLLRADGVGYPHVVLWKEGVGKSIRVANCVAKTFLGERPDGQYVCHKNGDSSDSSLQNLYYGTPAQNVEDMRRHGTMCCGELTPWARLTEDNVRYIRSNPDNLLQRELGAIFGISQARVSRILNREQWKHVA